MSAGLAAAVIALLLAVLGAVLFLSLRMKPGQDPQAMALLQQQVNHLASQVSQQLASVTQQLQATTGQIDRRLDTANDVVREVQRQFGSLSKAAERMTEIGKNIADLQAILQPPKLRGALGELFLENVLSQILQPEYYSLQYGFKSGAKVDAVIKLTQGLVPVDAKFPLTSFKKIIASQAEEEKTALKKEFVRDVKKHIDAIASRYILPDEGTFDFALMYVPAENVYYEVIVKDEGEDNLLQYSFDRKVFPVSPNSFYAYLQTIHLGLKGMRIAKEAKNILDSLTGLQDDFGRFMDIFGTMGTHLTNAKNKYDEAGRLGERFGDKLDSIEHISGAPERKAIEG